MTGRNDHQRFDAAVGNLAKAALGGLLLVVPIVILTALDAPLVVSVVFLCASVVVLAVLSRRARRNR